MSKFVRIKTDRWPMCKLGNPDISHIILGQSPRSSTYNKEGKGIPFLQGKTEFGEIYPDFKLFCSDPIKIALEADILLSVRAPVGDLNIASRKCCIGRGLAAIRPNKATLYHLYLFYLLKLYKSFIDSISTGSTFKAIKKSDIENLEIPLPPLPEQKKIAEILSTVDIAIEKTDKAIEQTKQLKKNMMDILLKTKFKDSKSGRNETNKLAREWQNEYLGNLANLERGKFTHRPRNDPKFYGGQFPFIQTGDITESAEIIKKYSQTLNDEGVRISKLFKKGTLVISIAGNIGEVGILGFDAYFPDSIVGIFPNEKIINGYFLLYVLEKLQKYIDASAPRSTQKNINLEILKRLNIFFPSLKKQKRIVEYLNEFGQKIKLLKLKKEKLANIKKGLMNDLLTGLKRVRLES